MSGCIQWLEVSVCSACRGLSDLPKDTIDKRGNAHVCLSHILITLIINK